MLTRVITKTPEVVLSVGTVAAACPPALLWQGSALLSEQPSTAVRFSGSALSLPEFVGIIGGAKPAGPAGAKAKAAVNDGADLPQEHRQYHTMSRRDHRTWRPPH